MKLHQIIEPIYNDTIIGIDFGTTNSLIGVYENDQVTIIPDEFGKLIPSVVSYENDIVLVGHRALQSKEYIRSIKRYVSIKDLNNNIYQDKNILFSNNDAMFKIHNKVVSIDEICTDIFKYLKNIGEKYVKKVINKAVITVPAHFDDIARNIIKSAAEKCNIQVLRILNEPTAAAIAYQLTNNTIALVYDLGGGTFDVSILKRNFGITSVLATDGDNHLGGDDFDEKILNLLSEKTQQKIDNSMINVLQIKEHLALHDTWCSNIGDINVTITRDEMISACKDLIDRTLKIVQNVLQITKLKPNDISHIILAGGATKMPEIQKVVREFFQKSTMHYIDANEVVAIGATLQAKALLSGQSTLVDVVPLSLGIELLGGIVECIIPRNTPIPVIVKKYYTTYQNNQTGFKIHIVQGESATITKCRSLGEFELKGFAAKPAGEVKLEVIFSINADGLLNVSASDNELQCSYSMNIKPSDGLKEDDILKSIKNSNE